MGAEEFMFPFPSKEEVGEETWEDTGEGASRDT